MNKQELFGWFAFLGRHKLRALFWLIVCVATIMVFLVSIKDGLVEAVFYGFISIGFIAICYKEIFSEHKKFDIESGDEIQ